MAKPAHNRPGTAGPRKGASQSFIPVDKKAFDPSVALLFASSLGPVKPPPKSRYENLSETRLTTSEIEGEENEVDHDEANSSNEQAEISSEDEDEDEDDDNVDMSQDPEENSSKPSDDDSVSDQSQSDGEAVLARVRETVLSGASDRTNKKRKRADKEGDLEDVYMQRLIHEEAKEEEKRKKLKTETGASEEEDVNRSEESDSGPYTIPKHETQMDSGNTEELEKAGRTVFLGNVSSEAITSKLAKKALLRHLASFIEDLADHTPPHKVESLRFRSTAFASVLPKKAAFAKKEILDATTKSTNAYAVYSTQLAAREAAKRLNGSIVLNRHLRADWLAHPSKTDNRRCVFVGNLGFVDDESQMDAEEHEKKKKNKPPGDVEEGLWVQFSKAGKVESVRVIRDSKTRVGKGIAYVQFEDENSVEAALQFDDKKFPPLLPRKLRVTRARAQKKKPTASVAKPNISRTKGVYNAKVTDEQKTNQGRARAMLGKGSAFKTAESFVFEGHRASSKHGTSGLKLGGKKKGGKPKNRSSKRAAAWKAGGGKR